MNKAYRDTMDPGPHVVRLGGVLLPFGDGGLLRNPTEEQLAALRKDGVRVERFVEVDFEPPPAASAAPAAATDRAGKKPAEEKATEK